MKRRILQLILLSSLSTLIVCVTTGCTSMAGALNALAQDKNNVSVRITTIYGSMTYARTGSTSTNSTTSVASDGSITTKNP